MRTDEPTPCAEHPDPEIFFPLPSAPLAKIREALDCCDVCPVAQACLDIAVRENREGIWGGTTANQRRRMRAGRRHPSTSERRAEARRSTVRALAARGMSTTSIAELLGVPSWQVTRDRSGMTKEAASA